MLGYGDSQKGRDMDTYEQPKEYERPKDAKLFDMLVIVGLVFNVLIVIFILLYWVDLL